MKKVKNVLGAKVVSGSTDPMTGFYRDGCCNTGLKYGGTITEYARMKQRFLDFTKSKGNDLSTPKPEWNLPGVKAGVHGFLSVLRCLETYVKDSAPLLRLEATHEKAPEYVPLASLRIYQKQDENAA